MLQVITVSENGFSYFDLDLVVEEYSQLMNLSTDDAWYEIFGTAMQPIDDSHQETVYPYIRFRGGLLLPPTYLEEVYEKVPADAYPIGSKVNPD